jgi:hypothetical protein
MESAFQAVFDKPCTWQEATMVVIPKPNKPDYSMIKAYCPIALLNCVGNILEKLIAICLGQLAKSHNILHIDQIGGHPKWLTIDTAMVLIHNVEVKTKQGLVTSSLFLDVQHAFDNVSSARLLTTMHALGCPGAVTSWCSSFLSERTTALSFDGQTDIQCPIQTRIP